MVYINIFIALTILVVAFCVGVLVSNRLKTVIRKALRKELRIKISADELKTVVRNPVPANHWCLKNKCIAHSLGEVNGSVYTNSLEALNNSVKRGFKVFETDITFTTDGVPVLWHQLVDEEIGSYSEFSNSRFDYRYTHMSLEDLLVYMCNNPDLFFVIDSKNFESYRVSSSIKEIIESKFTNNRDLYNRLIIQISSEEQYYQIEQLKVFKYYHYIFAHESNILDRLSFLVKNNIHTASVRINIIDTKQIELLKEKGVYSYAYAPYLYELDHLKAIEKYFKCGVYGVFSHCITDSDLNLISGGAK